uniref:Uncharacterized protein n=1 Tax=Heterorhabditis bacteriophora TaxID=37862 RepID=A0A1I7WK99_HETBA
MTTIFMDSMLLLSVVCGNTGIAICELEEKLNGDDDNTLQ